MKRLAFWIVVGIVAANLYRHHSCARDGDDSGPIDVVSRSHDLGRDSDERRPRPREWVEGLPVPIVAETRVTEAEVETPRPRKAPRHRRSAARVRIAPSSPEPRQIVGQLSATEPRALDDARAQLDRAAADWLAPDVPRSWKPPAPMVDAMVVETRLRPVVKEYGTLYEATLRADFSAGKRAAIVRLYERELVARRLALLGGALGFALVCLGAVAGYIQADEATKGYYTNRLRLAAAAGVGAAGVAIYQVLT